jgi:hypothetical protein
MSPLLVYISPVLGIGDANISLLDIPVDDQTELIN